MTVFEISPFFPDYYYLSYFQIFLGLSLVFFGIVVRVLHFKGKVQNFKSYTGTAIVSSGIVFLILGQVSISQNKSYENIYSRYESGDYSVTEGIVEVLREQPKERHAAGDLIIIGNKEFEISFSRDAYTYRIPISHDGYLKSGVRVKICHINNDILKINLL